VYLANGLALWFEVKETHWRLVFDNIQETMRELDRASTVLFRVPAQAPTFL
jgi:hypothetical protein